jgi:predicted nuclease with RNAse H fold
MINNKHFFIGIDLGWKEKKTTGICVLQEDPSACSGREKIILTEDVFGKNAVKTISPYLKETKVIAIDAPLTEGRGKGKMRLFEKFLSTSAFRKEKVSPVPPALLSKLVESAQETAVKLRKKGFTSGINLIETFSVFVKKIAKNNFLPSKENFLTENEESSFICAKIAYLHSRFKTRYLGYKDGFLFLPEISFWETAWKQKFYQAWAKRDRLRYRYLATNVFEK